MKRNCMVKKMISLVCVVTALITMEPSVTLQAAEEVPSEDKYLLEAELCQQDNSYELSVGDYVMATGNLKDTEEQRYLESSEWGFCSYEEMKAAMDELGLPLCYYSNYDKKDQSMKDAVAFDGTIPKEAFGKYVYYWLGGYSLKDGTIIMDVFRSKYKVTAWDDKGNYTVSLNDNNKTVSVFSVCDGKSINFPSSIEINGKKYKINAVGDYALEDSEKNTLTSISLSSGITVVGKDAFQGAGKLKSITIKGNLTSVGKNAFAGINKKAVIKIKASEKNYDKIVKKIKKSGVPKSVKFKRIS